jgi:hypothetical protein
MKRLFTILFIFFWVNITMGQLGFENPYFPSDFTTDGDWKVQFSVFASQQSNSNSFDNQFFDRINKSGFVDKDLIQSQLDNISDKALSGQITNIGGGVFINSKQNPGNRFYYLGVEHHHYLDTEIDRDLVRLLLQGNKPFAGKTLEVPATRYYNNYFNQLKGGIGFTFGADQSQHRFIAAIAINSGQNYDYVELNNSSIYTHPDGDYLDIAANVKTQLSDTVWAKVWEMNGIGISADLDYSYLKTENFFVNLAVNNMGLLFWNGNTYTGEIDTTFVFEGLSNDSTSNQNLPDDYSYNSLRRLLFKNPSDESFSAGLPFSLRFSAGKYLGGDKFLVGIKGSFFPTLQASYLLEVFGTWNIKDIIYLTPIFKYSSYGKVNYGLAAGIKVQEKIRLNLGSGYLNSMLNKNELLGSGGFVQLVFIP